LDSLISAGATLQDCSPMTSESSSPYRGSAQQSVPSLASTSCAVGKVPESSPDRSLYCTPVSKPVNKLQSCARNLFTSFSLVEESPRAIDTFGLIGEVICETIEHVVKENMENVDSIVTVGAEEIHAANSEPAHEDDEIKTVCEINSKPLIEEDLAQVDEPTKPNVVSDLNNVEFCPLAATTVEPSSQDRPLDLSLKPPWKQEAVDECIHIDVCVNNTCETFAEYQSPAKRKESNKLQQEVECDIMNPENLITSIVFVDRNQNNLETVNNVAEITVSNNPVEYLSPNRTNSIPDVNHLVSGTPPITNAPTSRMTGRPPKLKKKKIGANRRTKDGLHKRSSSTAGWVIQEYVDSSNSDSISLPKLSSVCDMLSEDRPQTPDCPPLLELVETVPPDCHAAVLYHYEASCSSPPSKRWHGGNEYSSSRPISSDSVVQQYSSEI